jgi:hypothetical protein
MTTITFAKAWDLMSDARQVVNPGALTDYEFMIMDDLYDDVFAELVIHDSVYKFKKQDNLEVKMTKLAIHFKDEDGRVFPAMLLDARELL